MTLKTIRNLIRPLKLDDSLLFFSRLLAVARKEAREPTLERLLSQTPAAAPTFVCQFIAKHIILECSMLGTESLDWPRFRQITDAYFEFDDPIASDPGWKDADPTGFFERFLGQQLPFQQQRPVQQLGLALGLFRDTDSILRAELEAEIGLTIDNFIQFGFLCRAAAPASFQGVKCPGTLNYEFLTKAFQQGVKVAVPEVWQPFLRRVACTPSQFQMVCDQPVYRLSDDRFATSEFNALLRFPMCEVQSGKFIAPDAELITTRTTWGLFYDMFERYGRDFTTKFGDIFSSFVGRMLASACPHDALWSADKFTRNVLVVQRPKGRFCDWAYRGTAYTVLIECKSLRPSLELTAKGSESAVQHTAERIADALDQLIQHDAAIQRGEWAQHGLPPAATIHVVLTYGRLSTINGPFFRKRVRDALSQRGKTAASFVVLSLEEFDSIIRLLEVGKRLDDVIFTLSSIESFDVIRRYEAELKKMAISAFAFSIGKAALDSIVPEKT